MGNLGSLRRSLEECGADVDISNQPSSLVTAERVLLPGVGSFSDGMAQLVKAGWIPALRTAVIDNKKPLLGICLGMQLLADQGEEGGKTAGLGFISGEVKKLDPDMPGTRIPHVGWNEIHFSSPPPLLSDVPSGTDYYFVHSYHLIPQSPVDIVARTPYCGTFVSIVRHENVYGVQFHPEKSQKFGLRILRNFLQMQPVLC